MTKLAVVGSRGYNNYSELKKILDNFENISIIISGGAKGPDTLTEIYIKLLPDWEKYGKAAGMIRNRYIIGGADYIVAFWDGKSPGTKNSIDLAKKLIKPIKIIQFD